MAMSVTQRACHANRVKSRWRVQLPWPPQSPDQKRIGPVSMWTKPLSRSPDTAEMLGLRPCVELLGRDVWMKKSIALPCVCWLSRAT